MKGSGLLKRFRSFSQTALTVMLLGGVFYLGMYAERTGFISKVLDPGLKKITLPVLNAFKAEPPEIPLIDFIVSEVDIDSLSAIRERALERGVLIEGKDQWYSVSLNTGDSTFAGKIRLKGGLTDHLQDDKWSFRVKLDSSKQLMGCRRFSLQHPNTRNFTYEWLFHQALAQEGLPGIPYLFVRLTINGEDKGIHAFEGHFDVNWAEGRAGVEGPVMKYDDEYRLIAISEAPAAANDPSLHPLAGWNVAPVDAFELKKVLRSDTLKRIHSLNKEALEAFRNGKWRASEVFEIRAMATFFAITDVLGAQHAQDWRNIRFAKEKNGSKLLPIGFDGNAGEAITAIRAMREQGPVRFTDREEGNFHEMLFSDSLFYKAYIEELERVSDQHWLESLFNRNREALERNIRVINSEFPRFEHENSVFEECAEVIRRNINPSVLASCVWSEQENAISITPLTGIPLKLHSISCGADSLQFNSIIYAGRASGQTTTSRIPIRENMDVSKECTISLGIWGTSRVSTIQIEPLKTP